VLAGQAGQRQDGGDRDCDQQQPAHLPAIGRCKQSL
jgi:hypothetical protein